MGNKNRGGGGRSSLPATIGGVPAGQRINDFARLSREAAARGDARIIRSGLFDIVGARPADEQRAILMAIARSSRRWGGSGSGNLSKIARAMADEA